MLMSKAEITALKVIGEYMDASAKMLSGTWGFALRTLLELGLLKYNRERTCLRLSEAGAEILRGTGVEVKEYGLRSKGRILERRLQNSEVALFFNEIECDVFLERLPRIIDKPMYLSSSALRRQKSSNVLGMSKFLGLFYTAEMTYAVYNVSDTAEIFYPSTDEDIFTRELISANAPTRILYVSEQSLDEMVRIFTETTPAKMSKHGCTFYQAIERFDSPVNLVSMRTGINQLRVMLTQDYKAKISRFMLDTGYRTVNADFLDAEFADGYFFVFIDFDVKRLEAAMKVSEKLHILVLEEQLSALEILLKNRTAEIYAISADKVFEILGIATPENMNAEPFRGDDGKCLIVRENE
jgi:hypothetical protein